MDDVDDCCWKIEFSVSLLFSASILYLLLCTFRYISIKELYEINGTMNFYCSLFCLVDFYSVLHFTLRVHLILWTSSKKTLLQMSHDTGRLLCAKSRGIGLLFLESGVMVQYFWRFGDSLEIWVSFDIWFKFIYFLELEVVTSFKILIVLTTICANQDRHWNLRHFDWVRMDKFSRSV